MAMELPDEAILYNYQGLLAPVGEEWTAGGRAARAALPVAGPAQGLRTAADAGPQPGGGRARDAQRAAGNAAARRRLHRPAAGRCSTSYRRKGDASDLGRVLALATRLRDEADRVVLLGVGGSQLGARALFQALKSAHHNELPPETRLGVPRIYFDGDNFDNDALQELLDLLQITCVDPEQREERWAVVCISKSGATLEPAVALRVFRREATEYYGLRSRMAARRCSPP